MDNVSEEIRKYKTYDGNLMDYFETNPSKKKDAPRIIVISEIWGLTEFVENVCRRLSIEGYSAIAPDLYSRPEDKELFTEENLMDAMRPVWSLPPEKRRDPKAMEDLLSKASDKSKKIINSIMLGRENIEKRMIKDLEQLYDVVYKGSKSKKGVVGFCMGGGLAFQLSTQKQFDASVIFYGANPRNIDDVSRIKGAIFGIYAGEDSSINSGLPALIDAVVKYKPDFMMKLYPGTFHAFFNDSGMSYHKEAASDAWIKTLSFYGKYLKGE